jgi:hypothetical protein
VASFILVAIFVGIFFNMTIDTFRNNIITAQITQNYDEDPTQSFLSASSDHGFMFAVGLTGIDLSSSQRYFDLKMNQKATFTNSSGKFKQTDAIKLEPCTA